MTMPKPRHYAALALIAGLATLAAFVAFADARYLGAGW